MLLLISEHLLAQQTLQKQQKEPFVNYTPPLFLQMPYTVAILMKMLLLKEAFSLIKGIDTSKKIDN